MRGGGEGKGRGKLCSLLGEGLLQGNEHTTHLNYTSQKKIIRRNRRISQRKQAEKSGVVFGRLELKRQEKM